MDERIVLVQNNTQEHRNPFFYVPCIDHPARFAGQGDFFLVSVCGFFFYNLGSAFLLGLRFGLESFDDQLIDFER